MQHHWLPWRLLCDVIWAPPECNTTSKSPNEVTEQLRTGSQESVDQVNGGFHEIVDNDKILTFGGGYLLCT